MLETKGVITSVIIGGIIFVIVFVAANIAEYYKHVDRKIYKITSAVCIIALVVEFAAISSLNTDTSNTPTEEIQKWKNNLVAIRSDVWFEGSARGALTFLVADIGEEDVYTFYYETSDGGYKKGTINSSNVTIHETDKEEPSIIEYKKGIKGIPLSSILNFKDETNSEVDYTKDSGEDDDVWYEIFVPAGTIVRNFSLE